MEENYCPEFTVLSRSLLQFAPHEWKALGQTELLHLHLAAIIDQTLRSEAYVPCVNRDFLFLITCDLCCYECLRRNHLSLSQEVFPPSGISLKQAVIM